MAEIADVRQLFYDKLKVFADAQTPALRIRVDGSRFEPGDNETWLEFYFRNAEPSKPYAGTNYISKEKGFAQVNVIGPEGRKQKAFEKIAWAVRVHFWPTNSEIAPTLGPVPLVVRLGPTAPYVRDLPSPDPGKLGSMVSIDWHADIKRT